MIALPKNALGKNFTWSYSALSAFEQCPARYASERFYCTTKQEPTVHTVYGTQVHKALEERLRDGVPLAEDFAGYEPWARVIEKAPGDLFCEQQFAIDQELNLVPWFSGAAWGRGVVDVLKIDGKKASVFDWKTGKVKNEDLQLKIFACFVSLLYPEIEEFNCKFIWLKSSKVTGVALRKEELGPLWSDVARRVYRMMEAWENGHFPCRSSGLCRGWCPAEECIHWRPKRP